MAGYVQLYSQARLDTLDALDRMTELRQAEELKSKLLFSIIVVRKEDFMMMISKSFCISFSAFIPISSQNSVRVETEGLHHPSGQNISYKCNSKLPLIVFSVSRLLLK